MQDIIAQGTEFQLQQRWSDQLAPFWLQLQHGQFSSHDNLTLHYSYYLSPQRQRAIVICAGRMETAVKYSELIFDLATAGYSVFILDHRGQGQSDRLLLNRHKGYVADFKDYADDFSAFIEQIVRPQQHQQHIAFCHSMGGAIFSYYTQLYPQHPFSCAVLASPMFGINTGIIPLAFAEKTVEKLTRLNSRFGRESWYFPGQQDYFVKTFAANFLTTSKYRYQWLSSLYTLYPDTQLGGATLGWLTAAIRVMKQLQQQAQHWNLPVLLLQAQQDKVVSNKAQDDWYQQLPAVLFKQKQTFSGARHELFMETDSIRQHVLTTISAFLAQQPL